MKLLRFSSVFSLALLLSCVSLAQSTKVKDYLHIPGPVEFKSVKYALSWSSHPSATYYKQEYLSAKETSDKFTRMIMIEAVEGTFNLKDLVKQKTTELDGRKSSDPVSNYKVIENKATGEYLLDFTLSAPGANNETIVEWNAYRYRQIKDKSGKKGIMLFAYSRRAYGAATTNFLKGLQKERPADIQVLAAYPLPDISL